MFYLCRTFGAPLVCVRHDSNFVIWKCAKFVLMLFPHCKFSRIIFSQNERKFAPCKIWPISVKLIGGTVDVWWWWRWCVSQVVSEWGILGYRSGLAEVGLSMAEHPSELPPKLRASFGAWDWLVMSMKVINLKDMMRTKVLKQQLVQIVFGWNPTLFSWSTAVLPFLLLQLSLSLALIHNVTHDISHISC